MLPNTDAGWLAEVGAPKVRLPKTLGLELMLEKADAWAMAGVDWLAAKIDVGVGWAGAAPKTDAAFG